MGTIEINIGGVHVYERQNAELVGRIAGEDVGIGAKARCRAYAPSESEAWVGRDSGVQLLEEDDVPLLQADGQVLRALWGAGNHGLSGVARCGSLLRGHGGAMGQAREELVAGARGCERAVWSDELRLASDVLSVEEPSCVETFAGRSGGDFRRSKT